MKKSLLLIALLSITNSILAQEIQHEPQKEFVKHLNNGNRVYKYAREHKIKKIEFYRDKVLTSYFEFNKNGDIINETGKENKRISKTLKKYNDQNQLIETRHFNLEGTFKYGSFYIYKKDTTFIYNIKDSLLSVKNLALENGRKSLSTVYNDDGIEIIRKTLWEIDENGRKPIESWSKDGLYKTNDHIYENINNSTYITNVEYDSTGNETNRTKSILEKYIPSKKIREYYLYDEKKPSSIDFLDNSNNRIKIIEYDYNGKEKSNKIFKYTKNNLVKFCQKENYRNDKISTYKYKFDKNGYLKSVIKKSNDLKEVFRYKIVFF